ncbi:MAG TPA: radical SAM protein [Syntrophorhabdaceae bacterium]|nr:radical SAM protein [Syntrophorhabdaceae bacterium]
MKRIAGKDGLNNFSFFVQWHITEKCNLACSHCYQQGIPQPEMSFYQIRESLGNVSDTINQWSDIYDIPFDVSVNVTGGEPFVRTDLFEILGEVCRHGFGVFLMTNGTLVTKEKAHMLQELQVNGVQVSLEGPETVHDGIRGRNSFASALNGIEHLLSEKLDVTLNATLSDINAPYWKDIVKIAKDKGVKRVGFSRLVPNGKGANLLKSMISACKMKKIYEEIASMSIPGLDIMSGDPLASQTEEIIQDYVGGFPDGGCAAGFSGLTLMTDGTITPCRRIGIPVGNILKDSLRKIWVTSDVLNALRDKKAYKGKCGSCRRWAMCRGCRAVAYAYSVAHGRNDLFEEDPQCFCYSGEMIA